VNRKWRRCDVHVLYTVIRENQCTLYLLDFLLITLAVMMMMTTQDNTSTQTMTTTTGTKTATEPIGRRNVLLCKVIKCACEEFADVTKVFCFTLLTSFTGSSRNRSLSGHRCLCRCLCKCLCKCLCECLCERWCGSGAAGDTSWVGGPLTNPPTHCCHLSLWDKPWVTLEHYH